MMENENSYDDSNARRYRRSTTVIGVGVKSVVQVTTVLPSNCNRHLPSQMLCP